MKIVTLILIMSLLSYNSKVETYKLICKDGYEHEYFFKPLESGEYRCLVHFTNEDLKVIKEKR